MLKVCVDVPGGMSRAMTRVANALRKHAPKGITFVKEKDADFRVLHVIGSDVVEYVNERPDMKYAVIQYCWKSAGEGPFEPVWDRAKLVWSYYDLPTPKLYLTPLGVDPVFIRRQQPVIRETLAMSSGYVAGPGAEAIEEIMRAAETLKRRVVHLGPVPIGLMGPVPERWQNILNVTDLTLAAHYHRSLWVSGLRHVEGFELPALEGLVCGARPIMFDRPEARRWFEGHATFVPECSGQELIGHLIRVMRTAPEPVSHFERASVLAKFDWEPIVTGFWERAL